MATEKHTTTDPGQMLYGFASRAMEIYAIADMLAQNIESADEPGPACSLIASGASKLSDELFDLAGKLEGNLAPARGSAVVSRSADAREAAKPANGDDAPRPGYDLLMDIQIQVGEVQGVAELAGETLEDADDVLSMLARRAEAIADQMNWLIPYVEGKAGNGATALAETRRRLEAACATMSAEECSQRLAAHLLYASRNLAADIGDDFTVTETCTLKGLRTLVARQELLQSALPDYEPTELYRRAVNGAA